MQHRFGKWSAAGLALAVWIFAPGATLEAKADPYKWCARYSRSGGNNCGFITLEQCRATVSGIGGSCEPNLFYTGPDHPPRMRKKKQSRRD